MQEYKLLSPIHKTEFNIYFMLTFHSKIPGCIVPDLHQFPGDYHYFWVGDNINGIPRDDAPGDFSIEDWYTYYYLIELHDYIKYNEPKYYYYVSRMKSHVELNLSNVPTIDGVTHQQWYQSLPPISFL